ncbi:MAG: hypothetical protein H6738_17735 [Alphaproteobacteria bacterium]|nr:hypothetical protein [Alphaproteobacteria bacterium]MCB9698627.1 hypothetical protein [Alphaproteobacteria bacterium]
MRWWTMAAVAATVSCSGATEPEPEGREICGDEIDNNGNGLIDCEDTKYCGGLQCLTTTTGDDDDDTTDLPVVEIDDPGGNVSFSFTPGGCPQLVKTYHVVNRSDDTDGLVDASCDLLGNDSVFRFVVDGSNPTQFVVDEDLYAGTQMQLDMYFTCGTNQAFTTRCRVKGDVGGIITQIEFDVSGSPF